MSLLINSPIVYLLLTYILQITTQGID